MNQIYTPQFALEVKLEVYGYLRDDFGSPIAIEAMKVHDIELADDPTAYYQACLETARTMVRIQ